MAMREISQKQCTVLNTVMAASVPALTSRYYLALGAGAINQYLLFLLIDLLFFICCVIYLSSSFIVAWKAKAPEHRYKGENLFFFGQITSKLNTTSKTMTLICVTLVLAIFMFIAAPILVGWASGYLDIRSMYDVQISSRYNDVYDEENLPDDNYELVTDFLSEHGIETDYDCTFSLYLPSKDDFHNRMKYDFPVVAISLSDYNTIRKMLGYEPITLSEDEFTTQWQSIATNEERDSFLKEHSSILTDAGELTLSEHSFYEEAIGETAYNSYTDVLYPGDCDGQSGYGVSKLDSIVEEVVRQIFAQFREVSRKKLLESVKTNDAARIQKKIQKIQKDLEAKQKELDDLKAETILVIRGVSALDKELLGTLVAEAKDALETLEKQLVQAQEEYEEATKTAKRSNYICNELFTWADVYDTANHDERRAILQQFIKEIRVRKDYEISITLNTSFNQVEQLKAVSTYDGAEIFEEISEKGA